MSKVITECESCGMEYTISWREDIEDEYQLDVEPNPNYCPCCGERLDTYVDDGLEDLFDE